MSRFPLFLPIPLAAVLWALGTELTAPDAIKLHKDYLAEQNEIDLQLAELALEASDGTTPPEVVQEKIDQWVKTNENRLNLQAERAAELDTVLPLPRATEPEAAIGTSPALRRVAELDALQNERVRELGSQAPSAEDLQDLMDEWAKGPEGKAVMDERLKIFSEISRANPIGSETIVLEASEDASQAEVATLDIQERSARRIQDIRSRNPAASDEEMQRLIDESKTEFEEDAERLGQLMHEVRQEKLEATIARLRIDVSTAKALSSK